MIDKSVLEEITKNNEIHYNRIYDLLKTVHLQRPDIDRSYPISATIPYYVDYRERERIYIFTGTTLTLSVEDLGTYSVPAGVWTEINFPQGYQLYATGQVAQIFILIKCTDGYILNASAGGGGNCCTLTNTLLTQIETNTTGIATAANQTTQITDLGNITTNTSPGVQGWIAASGTGTSGQDDSITFANQVRKVVLYNASANPVPFEFDQTSAATSIPIQPGQYIVVDDVLCTVVHVFPSATLPINTTSGLYVKGWK